jgi:hypothetical protein
MKPLINHFMKQRTQTRAIKSFHNIVEISVGLPAKS